MEHPGLLFAVSTMDRLHSGDPTSIHVGMYVMEQMSEIPDITSYYFSHLISLKTNIHII